MKFPREKNGYFDASYTTYLDQNWLSFPSQTTSFYHDSARFFIPSEAVSILLWGKGGGGGVGGWEKSGIILCRGRNLEDGLLQYSPHFG